MNINKVPQMENNNLPITSNHKTSENPFMYVNSAQLFV